MNESHLICAPIGASGNHLRWLVLLSAEYRITSISKIDFITRFIYPKVRNCFNWLSFEWPYRMRMDRILPFDHNINKLLTSSDQPKKIIIVKVTPELSLRSYLKINPGLNGYTADEYCLDIAEHNNSNVNLIPKLNEQVLVIDGDLLYNESLDKNLYYSIINFLNIEDQYELACTIHSIWYKLHEDSIKMVTEISEVFDKDTFPWSSIATERSPKLGVYPVPKNQQEYDEMLRLINSVYGK